MSLEKEHYDRLEDQIKVLKQLADVIAVLSPNSMTSVAIVKSELAELAQTIIQDMKEGLEGPAPDRGPHVR